jgi:hypothetical protein
MARNFKLCIISVSLKMLTFSALAQTDQKTQVDNTFKDTNNYAVFSIAQFKVFPFDSTYIPTILTAKEIEIVEVFFFKAIEDYNRKISQEIDSFYKDPKEIVEMKNDLLIPISTEFYTKQLLPAINKNGEKIVYINCFGGKPSEDFWKHELVQVSDGGNNFFNLIINITKGTFYNVKIGDFG